MTQHTVTVTETVESQETVYTCDYCGLGDSEGEVVEYNPDNKSGITLSPKTEQRDGIEIAVGESADSLPELHYHVSCIPKVVNDDEQAEAITLKSQYDRRSGDSLLFIITRMSLLFYGIGAGLLAGGVYTSGLLSFALYCAGTLWLLLTLGLSHREARKTVEEFST